MNRFTTTAKKNTAGNGKNHLPILIISSNTNKKTLGPKCLWQYDAENRFIDFYQKYLNQCFNNCDIYLSVGFEADKVIKNVKNIKLLENYDYLKLNESEDIRIFLNATQAKHFLVIADNIKPSEEIYLKNNISQTFISHQENDLKLLINGENVNHIGYEYTKYWSGIIYFSESETELIKSLLKNREYSHYYLFELINLIIENNGSIKINENINI